MRHELYDGSLVCPHAAHTSTCPPSAAVLQRTMSRRTTLCSGVTACVDRYAAPCLRTMSASSKAGRADARATIAHVSDCTCGYRVIASVVIASLVIANRSSGLTKLATRAAVTWMYRVVLGREA